MITLTTILTLTYFATIGVLSVLIAVCLIFTVTDLLNRDYEGTLIGFSITIALSLALSLLVTLGLVLS
jgi:hypothetical protein